MLMTVDHYFEDICLPTIFKEKLYVHCIIVLIELLFMLKQGESHCQPTLVELEIILLTIILLFKVGKE